VGCTAAVRPDVCSGRPDRIIAACACRAGWWSSRWSRPPASQRGQIHARAGDLPRATRDLEAVSASTDPLLELARPLQPGRDGGGDAPSVDGLMRLLPTEPNTASRGRDLGRDENGGDRASDKDRVAATRTWPPSRLILSGFWPDLGRLTSVRKPANIRTASDVISRRCCRRAAGNAWRGDGARRARPDPRRAGSGATRALDLPRAAVSLGGRVARGALSAGYREHDRRVQSASGDSRGATRPDRSPDGGDARRRTRPITAR
jgi:hypothetical protein